MSKPAQISPISNYDMETPTIEKKVEGRRVSVSNRGIRRYSVNPETVILSQPLEIIAEGVARYFSITKQDLFSNSQARKYCYPKQIYIYLLSQETKMSLQGISDMWGKTNDHTFALRCRDKIKDYLQIKGDSTIQDIRAIRKLIKQVQHERNN